jgi:hypothetical protein
VRETNHQFKSAAGELVDVRHLLRSVIIFSDLRVLVVSDSSWTWTVAAAQAGMGSISCLALSPAAHENLTWLRQGKLSLLDIVVLLDSTELEDDKLDLLLVEFFGGEYFADVPWSAAKRCADTGPAQLFRLMKQTHQQVWSI